MADPIITQVACPDCLRPINVRQHGSEISCQACGGQYTLTGHYCIRCYSYSLLEQERCGVCDAPLIRYCDLCGAAEWMGDEACGACDAVLGGEEILKLFRDEPVTDRLRRQMHQAQRLKAVETQAAEQRSAELAALDEQREAADRARQQAEARVRRIILIAVGILVMLVIVFASVALLSISGA